MSKPFASYIIGSDCGPLAFGDTMRECADNANKAEVEWGDTMFRESTTVYPGKAIQDTIESIWLDHITGKTYKVVTRAY